MEELKEPNVILEVGDSAPFYEDQGRYMGRPEEWPAKVAAYEKRERNKRFANYGAEVKKMKGYLIPCSLTLRDVEAYGDCFFCSLSVTLIGV